MKYTLISTLAASSLLFTSCGEEKTETVTDAVESASAKEPSVLETVQNWKKDLTNGQLANIWNYLPETYQSDITELTHDFAGKADAEVYNEGMKTLRSLSLLLKNKKGLILEIIGDQAPPEGTKMITESYDSIVGLVHSLSNSDAKDIDGLKTLDVSKLLTGIQGHTQQLSKLSQLAATDSFNLNDFNATVVSETAESATLNVSSGDHSNEVKLTRKDNQWVPVELVENWPEMMKEANQGLATVENLNPQDKQKALIGIRIAQATIKDLGTLNTKEEIMQKLQSLMLLAGGL